MNARRSPAPFPRLRPLCAALLAALLAPPVLAQDDEFSLDEPTEAPADPARVAELTEIRNWVEVGMAWVDDDAFRFGRYTGLEEQGGYGVLNIDWFQRGAWNDPQASYWRFTGTNLGLASRSAAFETGRQGSYRLRVDYDQTPSYRSDSAATVFSGAGSARLVLPPDWVAGASTAAMSRLLPSLSPVDLQQERRRVGIGIERRLSERWSFSGEARHERKDGLKSIGAVIGNSGGNPRAAILPEPVDYETRTFDLAASYHHRKLQFQARWHVSLFDNAISSLTWQNPFAAINGWDASAGYPGGEGRIALPPDNSFHQASLLGAYNLSERTRISADVAFGRMRQNDAFLPYTVNPTLADSVVQPLPRDSLDGRIDTTAANLRISSRPSDAFNWAVSYRFDDRDNRTPRNEYVYIGGDSQLQDAGPASSRRRYNEPASYREHRLRGEGGYRFGSGTRLTAHVERREIDRTYSEREEARETTVGASLRHSFGERVTASLRASRAERRGSTYHGDEPFLSGYDPGYTGTVVPAWENAPGLRKPHLADRERDRVGAQLQFAANEAWNFGIDYSLSDDDYSRSELGLQSARLRALTLDASWMPTAQTTVHGFWTQERMAFDQRAISLRGGASRPGDAEDPNRLWFAAHDDDVDSAGFGLTWRSADRRWKFGGDLVRSHTRGEVDVTTGSSLTSAPLPPLRTELRTASLQADYRLSDRTSLRARLLNERYRSDDWSLDGVEANQLANVILMGEDSPDYSVNAVLVSVTFSF